MGANEGFGIAADGQGHLFVSNPTAGTVGEYNAVTGALINSDFVSGAYGGFAVDNAGPLFVADYDDTIGRYNISNGSAVNARLVSLSQFTSDITGLATDNQGALIRFPL